MPKIKSKNISNTRSFPLPRMIITSPRVRRNIWRTTRTFVRERHRRKRYHQPPKHSLHTQIMVLDPRVSSQPSCVFEAILMIPMLLDHGFANLVPPPSSHGTPLRPSSSQAESPGVLSALPQTQPFSFRLPNTSSPAVGRSGFTATALTDEERKREEAIALAALARLGFSGISAEDFGMLNPPDEYEKEMELMAEVRAYFQVSYKVCNYGSPVSKSLCVCHSLDLKPCRESLTTFPWPLIMNSCSLLLKRYKAS